jgi:hypothetical protein
VIGLVFYVPERRSFPRPKSHNNSYRKNSVGEPKMESGVASASVFEAERCSPRAEKGRFLLRAEMYVESSKLVLEAPVLDGVIAVGGLRLTVMRPT